MLIIHERPNKNSPFFKMVSFLLFTLLKGEFQGKWLIISL